MILAFILGCAWSGLAQEQRCQSFSFKAELSENESFLRELGGGIWFTVYPADGSWTIRIGPGREPKGPFDIGWSLDWAWTPEWQLGPTHDHDADAAMKFSPRHLWFAVADKEYQRLRASQRRELSSDSKVVESGEHDSGKVVAEIQKGLATVVISEYRLSEVKKEKGRDVVSATLTVTVNTPSSFPLVGAVPHTCPTERPGSPHP